MILELLRLTGMLCTVVAGLHAAWWLLLALVALPRRRMKAIIPGDESIAVVVPAHDEELMVGATIRSLQGAAEQHQGTVEICVVADNCTDGTAELARAAGATVFERHEPTRRGKGYALDFALAELIARRSQPDIVAFVDADTVVSENFIAVIADRIRRGAQVAQVYYAAGPGDEPIRRVRRLAFALVHWTRPLGASRLGLGTSLKGNGMAYRWHVAKEGLGGSGIVEDAEMSLLLASSGVVIAFEPRATVWGYMAANWNEAKVQDSRWERGRLALWRSALMSGARSVRRNPRAVNAALEVLSLPLVWVVCLALAGLAIEWTSNGRPGLSGAVAGATIAYPIVGWVAARVSLSDLGAAVAVPLYMVHKLHTVLLASRPSGWRTTSRG